MNAARGLLVLAVLTGGAATQLGHPIVAIAVLPFIATLLAAHLDREAGALARSLVEVAAGLLPAEERADMRDEWRDHVASAGERGVLPLTRAISIALIAAPTLAVGLRIGRRQRAPR